MHKNRSFRFIFFSICLTSIIIALYFIMDTKNKTSWTEAHLEGVWILDEAAFKAINTPEAIEQMQELAETQATRITIDTTDKTLGISNQEQTPYTILWYNNNTVALSAKSPYSSQINVFYFTLVDNNSLYSLMHKFIIPLKKQEPEK